MCLGIFPYALYSEGVSFDAERAQLAGPDFFPRFRATGSGVALGKSRLMPDGHVLVVERGGERVALSLAQMTFHHVAQGDLAGQPYLVAF